MKIWTAFGSEHSSNIVLIGHFKEAVDAQETKELMERLSEVAFTEPDNHRNDYDNVGGRRFGTNVTEIIEREKLYMFSPIEIEQFTDETSIKQEGEKLIITSDEFDLSAYIKLMINREARIEMYSAHHHPNTNYGR